MEGVSSMKIYTAENHFYLTGKGWQIRAYLRRFKDCKTPLQKYLDMHRANGASR
jgi:hypothetical protein